MRREPYDLARLLLDKAAQDEAAVHELLRNRQVADEIVAFHAQQACEKALKAVLALHGVRYGRTHNLGTLLDLLTDGGVDVPPDLTEVENLTPFGVLFRYEDFPSDTEPFDRSRAYALVQRVREWAVSLIERP